MYTANDAIDIWIVERALGQGGMGSVYRCHNRDARRILAAIKVLDYGLKRSPKARARFVREAEILFSLDHPHIVKVRNVRLDADPPYLEMEFVEGGSLERRILQGPSDAPAVLRWLRQLASALSYLHGRGIRHRDIKPSNILVNLKGDATLVDFGIATETDGGTLTETGQAMGSVAYVPPEWVHIGSLDPVKWDLYALGVCVYEACTGLTAFGVPSGGMSTQRFYQVLTAKQGHAPLDPGPNVPFGLRELVRDLTRADPAERIASADEILARLERLDLTDIRPAHVFVSEAPPPIPGGRRDGATPLGDTMVPADPSELPAPPPRPAAAAPSRAGSPPAAVTQPAGRARSAPGGRQVLGGLTLVVGAAVALLGVAGLGFAAWSLGRAGSGASAPTPTVAAAPPAAASPSAAPTPPAAAADVPRSGEPTLDAAPTPPTRPPPVAAASPRERAPAPGGGSTPEPAPPREATPPTETPPPPDPTPAAEAGPAVTHAQLAAWLERHPEWQAEAAVAAGKADDKYLRGWDGASPPAGKASSPAVGVTWSLATAYCAGRGGLASVDAAPSTWKEGPTQPWMEYRQDGGKPRWRRDDGVVSPQVEVTQSGGFIGFRCAR